MKPTKKKNKLFRGSTLLLASLGATGGTATALVLSWTIPMFNTDGSALTNLGGFQARYGTTPGTSDPTTWAGMIDVGNVTSATMPAEKFTPNTVYYFCVNTYTKTGIVGPCSNPGEGTPNEQGPPPSDSGGSGGSGSFTWVDTRVAMTVPGASPGMAYLFAVNTNGSASPVVTNSVGGYNPLGYSCQEDATCRLSVIKAAALTTMVWELGIASNMARGSSSINYTAATGAPANDSRSYTSESENACRLYFSPQGNMSLQKLNTLDFPGTLQGPYNTVPNAGANSYVDSTGATVTKIGKEVRCDAEGNMLVSLVYKGGGNDRAVSVWGFSNATWSIYAPSILPANLVSNISQSYLAAKQDVNGPYNYSSMAISGGAKPALNVAYTQTVAAGTKVVIDQYSGANYPGSLAAGGSYGPKASCSSAAFTYAPGTTVIRYEIQGDGLGRIWTQNGNNIAYTLTDTANCNASAGAYSLIRPTSVPSNASLIPNGL